MFNDSKMTTVTDSLMTRFTHALNSPIHIRCAELTVLIERYGSKDLQHVFPSLIESIFGTSGGMSWGLRNITAASHPQDFTTLHNFLGPLGPLFRLIYKLLTESQIKYEYSVAHLPKKIRQILENSKVPPFYTDLLNIDTQSRKVHSLSLNAFDYYMFNFAYYLTNLWQQRANIAWGAWNTVYYVLSSDYILHFLPTDPNVVVLPQLKHFTGKNPTIIPPQSVTNRPQCTSKLFRTHVLQQSTADLSSSSLHQPMQQHPRSEIWRSETIVQIFIDIWLSNDQINTVAPQFNPQSKVNELPSGEYVRIIRNFVKQLHAFSATGRNDATPLGELKKIVQPMLQGPMYAFLRHLVYRWPLDGSFRLVLELWLSFIQPWRYLGDNQTTRNQETEIDDPNAPITRLVDQQYLGFIADNLLAYTVIFQQLLPRFSRVDLASPKNALMLFRVFKVFAQPNLLPMIREIESCVNNLNHSPTHSYSTVWSNSLPPLSPTSSWSTNTTYNMSQHADYHNQSNNNKSDYLQFESSSFLHQHQHHHPDQSPPRLNSLTNKWAAIVRHRIYEWEGPDFCYKPMFTRAAAPEVFQLVTQIQIADKNATELLQQRLDETNVQHGIATFFKSLFGDDKLSDEFTTDDRKKASMYLTYSYQYLVDIFQINLKNVNQNQTDLMTSIDDSTLKQSNKKMNLSPISARSRVKQIKYQGDPDLHPIRSNENAFLVRVLYHLAQKINENYSIQFRSGYSRTDFLGKIFKQILCPPCVTYSYDKNWGGSSGGYSPRVQRLLPPRLSLRTFAGHSFLAYFLIGFFIAQYFGYGTFSFVFVLILFWSVLILLKTILSYKDSTVNRFYDHADDNNDASF